MSGKAPRSMRILVADDNDDAAMSLATLLKMRGHEVQVVGDGAAAVEASETFRPQIALLDISMPRMDGYATAGALRSKPWGRELLLVALTGWAQTADRARALQAGFDIHVAKPVDFDSLDRIIEQFDHEPPPR